MERLNDDDDPLERLNEIVARYIAAREAQRAEDATAVSPAAEPADQPADVIERDDCDGELVATVLSPDCRE